MPILSYESYSRASFEGQHIPEYGNSVYFGIQGQVKNVQPTTLMEGRIPYGRVVVVDSRGQSGEYNVSLPNNDFSKPVLGISIAIDTHTKKYRTSETYDPISNSFQMEAGIPSGKKLTLLRRGLVWVFSENELLANSTVYYRMNNPTPNTNQSLGRFRSDNPTPSDFGFINATVVRPCTSPLGGYALINVDIPLGLTVISV